MRDDQRALAIVELVVVVDNVEEGGVDLPDVVVERDALDGAALVLIEAGRAREHERVGGDAANVRAGLRVVGINGVEERFERGGGDAFAEPLIVPAAEGEGEPRCRARRG